MDELEQLRDRWHALRTRFRDSARAFDAWFDIELACTSQNHQEAVDHHHALAYIRSLAARDKPICEADVRRIRRVLLGRSPLDGAERYSTRQNVIAGTVVRFPTPAEIAPLMGDFGRWLHAAPASPDTAFEAHYRLVAIHPFSDGNGRTARLLMNLILLKAGYPPVAISPEERLAYLDAIEERQRTGDAEPYRAFLRQRLVASLERHIAELEREKTGA
ncbi:MAG TPA: Fic family protein [Azospirillum sp.]|nr:Fic family protein [Azospirillum sp.]